MIPKLHAKGSSFKGAAAYLLHDKDGAATSERVGWTETVNLATPNPQTAWRVMAATAMDAARLKKQAGVKWSGRVSKNPVLHLTLSWSPDQKPTREEMSDFARRAIEALKAGDRQAMIICHTDEKHPHVHVMLNRVSPTDGRMLSSSKEKLALSALALAYEKEGGEILCKQREINAAKREKGEHVRGEKDIPRSEFEAMLEGLQEVEKEIPPQLLKENPQAAATLRATMRQRMRAHLAAIKQQLRPQWQGLYQRQKGEMQDWRQQKASFVQRLTGWFGSRDKASSPAPGSGPGQALPFQQVSLNGLAGDDKLRAQKQRGERFKTAQLYKAEVRKAIVEVKTACQAAVRQIFVPHDRGGVGAEFRPAAAGGGPAPTPEQSAVQRRLSELAQQFRKQQPEKPKEPKITGPTRPKDKDRDREPD